MQNKKPFSPDGPCWRVSKVVGHGRLFGGVWKVGSNPPPPQTNFSLAPTQGLFSTMLLFPKSLCLMLRQDMERCGA